MVLRVSGKNVDIGQALRTRIDATVSATIQKYFSGGYSGHVTLSKSGRAFETECALHLDTGMVFEARGLDADAHASFDQAAERLENRMRRYKRRLRDYKRTPVESGAGASAYVIEAPSGEDEIAEDYAPAIIAETRLDLPTISVSTAVMQLDRTDAPVVIFRNPSHGGVNVVYRRADGHFGWVDPALADARRGETGR
jgi:ribosome hibernation promoting factor